MSRKAFQCAVALKRPQETAMIRDQERALSGITQVQLVSETWLPGAVGSTDRILELTYSDGERRTVSYDRISPTPIPLPRNIGDSIIKNPDGKWQALK